MSRSEMLNRLFLALAHASLAAGIYILLRDFKGRWDPLELIFYMLPFFTIPAGWWWMRRAPIDGLTAAQVALRSGLILSLIVILPFLLLAGARAASAGRIHWTGGIILISLVGFVVLQSFLAAFAGLIAGVIFGWCERHARVGLVLGLVFAVTISAFPLGTIATRVATGQSLPNFLATM